MLIRQAHEGKGLKCRKCVSPPVFVFPLTMIFFVEFAKLEKCDSGTNTSQIGLTEITGKT